MKVVCKGHRHQEGTQKRKLRNKRQTKYDNIFTVEYKLFVVVFLTLTDPLRIQPWSQDRRNQTKSNRESEISIESRQKRTDKEVASKGRRRDKIENINKNTQTVETNRGNRIKKRREGSPISGGIQPRHEDKGKGNGCNTQRNKNTDGEKETTIKGNKRMR